MLPTLNQLAGSHGAYCLKHHVAWHDCSGALGEALALAVELAGDRTEDEPAALLYALTLRPRALDQAWLAFPVAEACRHARRVGLHLALDVDDVELENLRLGAMDPRLGIGFDQIRAYCAARMRPAYLRRVK
jgi:hypothetical protein